MYAFAIVFHFTVSNLTTLERLQGILFLVIYAFGGILRTGYNLDNEPIHVINTFLKFEDKLPGDILLTST
jgi:hypothetical protein